jgi:hypothetical protein
MRKELLSELLTQIANVALGEDLRHLDRYSFKFHRQRIDVFRDFQGCLATNLCAHVAECPELIEIAGCSEFDLLINSH